MKVFTFSRSWMAALIMILGARLAPVCFADQPFSSSPLGPQKVLVIPVEYPVGNACPGVPNGCAADQAYYDQFISPPRRSAVQLKGLLDSVASVWWQQNTYGKTNFEFTVLGDPATNDGWWPATRTFAQYNDNGDSFTQQPNTPTTYAMVPDMIATVAQSICSNPVLTAFCDDLTTYNRVIIVQNIKTWGGVTYGNDFPFTVASGTRLGNLVMSASHVNEDSSDVGVTFLLHETGHQMGEISHYGDCSGTFGYTSFNPTGVPRGSNVECITYWDIMGQSPFFSEMSGYSKLSRGWIDQSAAPAFDMVEGGHASKPFTATFAMNPIEVAPTANHPGIIRLSFNPVTWAQQWGYYVECREQIRGDVASPFPAIPVGTIPDEGVLITNVHEFTVGDTSSIPAHHVERRVDTTATDPNVNYNYLAQASLHPGEEFTDYSTNTTVRFNGYIFDPNGNDLLNGSRCSVTVQHGSTLGLAAKEQYLSFAGVLPSANSSSPDSGTVSSDIGVNRRLASHPAVPEYQPVLPPWPKHVNPLFVRMHNRSVGTLRAIPLAVDAQQPATITERCRATLSQGNIANTVVRRIEGAAGAVTELPWTPQADASVSIEAAAGSMANRIHTRSSFAFQFHGPQTQGQGQQTQFRIAADGSCGAPMTYYVGTAVTVPGWTVAVSPAVVTVNPGEDALVSVTVTASPNEQPGDHAEIPVIVRMHMQTLTDTSQIPANTPEAIMPGLHLMPMGGITVLARRTQGPGLVTLDCRTMHSDAASDDRSQQACFCENGRNLSVNGQVTPVAAGSPVIVEYRSPSGRAISHLVYTDPNSGFSDSLQGREAGKWTVQARWSGGDANDPTESATLEIRKGRDR